MSVAKYRELVTKLYEKTEQNKLEWEPVFLLRGKNDVFQVILGFNTIRIMKTEPSEIKIEIINQEGGVSDSFTDEMIEDPDKDINFFSLMNNLYERARRISLKSDEVLDSILGDLDDDIFS